MFIQNKKNSDNKKADLVSKSLDKPYCRIPNIHVMPDIFLSSAAQNIKIKKKKKEKKQQKKKKKSIHKPTKKRLIHPSILVLVIILFVGLGSAVVYLLTINEETQTLVDKSNININLNINKKLATNIRSNTNKKPIINSNSNVNKKSVVLHPNVKTLPSYPTTVDSDTDFLTDIEEKLYSTGINNVDQDGDSYLDGLELINLYNPRQKTPSSLADSGLINIFNNIEQGYSIFYPKDWKIRYLNDDKSEVTFESSTVEFMEVLVTDNTRKESILSWAKKEFPDIDTSQLDRVTVGDNLGIRSPNGLVLNFIKEDKVYSVIYQVGTKRELNFKATFQMMYNSLKLYSREWSETNPATKWSVYTNDQIGFNMQHPDNLTVLVSEDSIISLGDFNLEFANNIEALELNSWFEKNYNIEENKDCKFRDSELKIGKLQTFLINKSFAVDTEEVCVDGGFYALSDDKTRVVKLTIGNNPVREMAQILSTFQLIDIKPLDVVLELFE